MTSLIALVLLFQVTTVEEAVVLLASQPAERVPVEVGRAAADLVRQGDQDLRQLGRVAAAGGAWRELADALVVALERGASPTEIVEAASTCLPALEQGGFARALSPSASASLLEVADREPALARSAVTFAVARGELWAVLGFLDRSAAADLELAKHVLVAIGRTGDGRWFGDLAGRDVPLTLATIHGEVLRDLVRSDPASADMALELSVSRTTPAVVRSLGGIRLGDEARRTRAVELLSPFVDAIQQDQATLPPELTVAVIQASAELLLPALLPALPALVERAPWVEVRVAAIRALGVVGQSDAPTIDRLLELLDGEPDVATAAYEVLVRKTGQPFALRVELWTRWRATAGDLLSSTESDEARLAKKRELLARAEQRALERAGR